MSEQEQTCATCGAWVDGAGCPRRGADDRSVACCYTDEVVKYPHWTPKPTAAPALPTLASEAALMLKDLDAWIANVQRGVARNSREMAILQYARPLVEAEECKAAIEAAGCMWTDRGQQPWYEFPTADIVVWDRGDPDGAWDSMEYRVATWADAAASAKRMAEERSALISAREEEAAKQAARERIASAGAKLEECGANGAVWWVVYTADGMMATFTPPLDKPGEHYYIRAADFAEAHRANGWSKPVHTMDAPEWDATVRALGGDGVPPGYGEGYVVGYAVKCNAFSFAGGRVWLGDGPMPQ